MSEIPTQSSLHESSDPDYYNDGYDTSSLDSDTASLDAIEPDGVPAADVDLDSDPFADDLSKELAAAAPKRWANRATIVIGALFLVVGGFLGGVQVEKHFGQQSSNTSAASLINQLRNRAAGGTGRGFGGAGTTGGFGAPTGAATASADTTTGTVKFVDGKTLYVTEADGTVIIVNTGTSTKVTISSTSTLSKLKVGQKVTVVGPTDSSGAVTASTVTGTP